MCCDLPGMSGGLQFMLVAISSSGKSDLFIFSFWFFSLIPVVEDNKLNASCVSTTSFGLWWCHSIAHLNMSITVGSWIFSAFVEGTNSLPSESYPCFAGWTTRYSLLLNEVCLPDLITVFAKLLLLVCLLKFLTFQSLDGAENNASQGGAFMSRFCGISLSSLMCCHPCQPTGHTGVGKQPQGYLWGFLRCQIVLMGIKIVYETCLLW